MRVKICYRNKSFFGGVVGKTTAGKMVVTLDGDESYAVDLYRQLSQVVILKDGRPVKNVNKLAKNAKPHSKII